MNPTDHKCEYMRKQGKDRENGLNFNQQIEKSSIFFNFVEIIFPFFQPTHTLHINFAVF